MKRAYSAIVVGGGIVGLATCYELCSSAGIASTLLLEKEAKWASHQTGRNSGVIHSGIYYRPNSLKAEMCVRGNRSMYAFCEQYGIPFERCGKLVVAAEPEEVPALRKLHERALQNGIRCDWLDELQARELEPNVSCLAAVLVPSTGITDYTAVACKYVELGKNRGAELLTGVEVRKIRKQGSNFIVTTNKGLFESEQVVVCAGLQSDRLVESSGHVPEVRIVPFRGEYFDLKQNRAHLVRNLIYPVPNPSLPFLGVHLTRDVHGHVHAGPNAVFSFRREGYSRFSFSFRDTLDSVSWPGFPKLAKRFLRIGIEEQVRSLSPARFAKSIQRLVPEIQRSDLISGTRGVRAQAVARDGSLVDDFVFLQDGGLLHVCNAPSPAATASLEIARAIVSRLGH